jgi:hypothetical protein
MTESRLFWKMDARSRPDSKRTASKLLANNSLYQLSKEKNMMKILKGVYDIHIDSNHRWETDKVMEIDAYPLILKEDGTTETDMQTTLASVRVPSFDVNIDMWVASSNMSEIGHLPQFVLNAYATAATLAMVVEQEKNK